MAKNMRRYVALIMSAMLVLSACGKDDKKKKEEDANATITLQMRGTDSFNPLSVTHHSVRDAFSLCYEPLFSINEKINLKGVLAQSIEVSDDCMSAIVILKDSVLWHDGIKFTSGDVVHTVNLIKENSDWEYFECVKYIDTVEAIDPLSLRIELSRPYGQIGYSLTFPIVPAHNSQLDMVMLGTGPYSFGKYTPAVALELECNGKWHGGEVKCKNVSISIIRDDMAATTAFNTGLLSAVTDGVFDTENTIPKADTKTETYHSGEYEYMALNHSRGIFSSQTVRNAVSSAIDRYAIVNDCYGGNAVAVNAPIHPAAHDIAESSLLSQYSLANASEMLFLEGYTLQESTGLLADRNNNILRFELLVNEENLKREKTAQLLAQQLFAAGIEVNITLLPFDEYIKRIESGSFDAYLGGTRIQNFYDFEALLSENGELNNYGYKGEYMQLALSGLCSAPGQDALSDAIFNFEEVFLREQPVCGLVFRTKTLLAAANIEGQLLPQTNAPYKNIWRWSLK